MGFGLSLWHKSSKEILVITMTPLYKYNPNENTFTESSDFDDELLLKSYEESSYKWPVEGKKLRMTKSTISAYEWCPYQYFLTYVMGQRGEETEAMVRGTNVHNVVEYFWHKVDDAMDEIKELLDDDKPAMAREKLKKLFPYPEEGYHHNEEVVIDQWFEWQWARLLVCHESDMIDSWKPVGNEVEVHAETTVEHEGKMYPVHLKGYVDRIFSDGDGGYILMELKTGKWKEAPYKYSSMRLEMEFYKNMITLAQRDEFLPVTHWAWEYPYGQVNGGDGADWIIEETKTKSKYAQRSLEKKMKKLLKAHIEQDFPPVHKDTCSKWCRCQSVQCAWCDFVHICPAWKSDKFLIEEEVKT